MTTLATREGVCHSWMKRNSRRGLLLWSNECNKTWAFGGGGKLDPQTLYSSHTLPFICLPFFCCCLSLIAVQQRMKSGSSLNANMNTNGLQSGEGRIINALSESLALSWVAVQNAGWECRRRSEWRNGIRFNNQATGGGGAGLLSCNLHLNCPFLCKYNS